jgi:hypothetical protein
MPNQSTDNPPEEWRPVVGFETHYSVSDLGRVMRTLTVSGARAGRILKPDRLPNGRYRVTLRKYGTKSRFQVHRLVATAFCSKPDGCDVVDHKDNNPANNRADNLQWVTLSQNILFSFSRDGREKRVGAANNFTKITGEEATAVRQLRAEGWLYKDIAPLFGIDPAHAGLIVKRRCWKHVP